MGYCALYSKQAELYFLLSESVFDEIQRYFRGLRCMPNEARTRMRIRRTTMIKILHWDKAHTTTYAGKMNAVDEDKKD